jgi:hypothetical protein
MPAVETVVAGPAMAPPFLAAEPIAVATPIYAAPAPGQLVAAQAPLGAPPEPPPFLAAVPQVGEDPTTPAADLAEQLRKTEARLRALEKKHDDNVKKDAEANAVLESLRERWSKVQDPAITTVDQQTYDAKAKKPSEKKWFDRLSMRGYTQVRWNETLTTEAGSTRPQYVGDRSIGDDQNFLIRRARLIISGDVSDRMYVYLQPDFASTPDGATTGIQFAQIRDWYADIYLDDCKINRIRVGSSKVPYGWENLQSSSNRLALDRSDALNSAVRNERDLGVFYYWTPESAQDFFKYVLDNGLKGSGNYGVFGFGAYNGQGGSLAEQNDDFHVVARLTLPYQFASGQCMEVGVQGYLGEYATTGTAIDPPGAPGVGIPAGTVNSPIVVRDLQDQRIAGTFVWYPQPIGFQAEWNVGRGPGLDPSQTLVEDRHLYGGYVQTMAKIDTPCWGTFFPFVRYVKYQGGWKPERNSPFSNIAEWETGTEWQINPQMELTTSLLMTDRTNTTAFATAGSTSYAQFEGTVLRFQFQFNY